MFGIEKNKTSMVLSITKNFLNHIINKKNLTKNLFNQYYEKTIIFYSRFLNII